MKRRKEKKKHYEKYVDKDISYRGPLSYRHLAILGWVCLAVMIAAGISSAGFFDTGEAEEGFSIAGLIVNGIGSMALPFFLIANFSFILDEKRGYKDQILRYGGLAFLVVLATVIVSERYLKGILTALSDGSAADVVTKYMNDRMKRGGANFNVFIDLLLCTLLMFFLNYEPQKYFSGNRKKLFRLLALVPVLYEAGSLVLRLLGSLEVIQLPVWMFSLMTTKEPMSFVLFLVLVLFIRRRKKHFRDGGRSEEEYRSFLQTNANSFQFSVHTSVAILITGLIDMVLAIVLPIIVYMAKYGFGTTEEIMAPRMEEIFEITYGLGIGQHAVLILMIPVILLFSYTRTYRNRLPDILIPIGGVLLCIITAVEGIYQAVLSFLK